MHRFMKQKLIVWTCCVWLSGGVYAQQAYTGSNSCLIRIATTGKGYQFGTAIMNARLNDVMNRFEFSIPVSSIKSLGDSSDVKFLKSLAAGNDAIVIEAALPDSKDPELDLSCFKGNRPLSLAGEVHIGRFTFENDIDFNGLLMGNNQSMAFDFSLFINQRASSLAKKEGNEQILEIELAARGDKIIGLTSNELLK